MLPSGIIIIAIVVILGAVAVAWFIRDGSRRGGPSNVASDSEETTSGVLPYEKVDSLLTPAERSFFDVLRPISEDEGLYLFAKVRMSDLVRVENGTDRPLSYQNKVSQKHVDFILCDRQKLVPLLAIELDDASHRRQDRQDRDETVSAIYAKVGLPFLQVRAARGYVSRDLSQSIREKLGRTGAANGGSSAAVETESPLLRVSAATKTLPAESSVDDLVGPGTERVCPKCGAPQAARQNPRDGNRFWGCSTYPRCRFTEPIEPVLSAS